MNNIDWNALKKAVANNDDRSAARSYTFTNLEPGAYSIKVKAYLKTDGKTVKGKYSKAKNVVLK